MSDLFYPTCAGASWKYYEVCPRCRATSQQTCGDEPALEAQTTLRNAHRGFASLKPAQQTTNECDSHEAAEAAAVAFYGSSVDDPKMGWITSASLQLGPHTPGVWTVPAVVDDEPEGLAWLPRNAWKTEGDL